MRILLAIGCNEYQHAPCLKGAERDAQKMFDSLLRPEVGDYSVTASKLLLSPSLSEVRAALEQTLFVAEPIDTFTLFFAGHGGVKSGSFYMWVRDSTYSTQSLTALSLADLLRSLNEATPKQSNIIIDACESGGLIADLGALLKSDVRGNAGTSGVTLVATSAQDQTSGEDAAGGYGTNAILDCIEGRDFIQDNAVALDLVEIGRHISSRLKATGQDPVVWGLNLYGPPRFCRNPCRSGDPAKPLRSLVHAWPANLEGSIQEHYDQLWQAYSSVSSSWKPRSFSDALYPVLSALSAVPEAQAGFVEKFGAAAIERAVDSPDAFRRAQVSATMAVCLLPYLTKDVVVRATEHFLTIAGNQLFEACKQLTSDLEADRFALLRARGTGLNQLFFLPIRIVKILGWIAAIDWIFNPEDDRRDEAAKLFSSLLRGLLQNYEGSIVAISDEQAPYLAVILVYAAKLGLQEEAEQLVGTMFNSIVRSGGKIARCDIPLDKTLAYLRAKQLNDFSQVAELIEQPVETFTVLLRAASMLKIEDVLDEDLWRVDGLGFMAYANSEYSAYGAETMMNGENYIWGVGHDVFRCADLSGSWPRIPAPPSQLVSVLTILACLLYPDRVPWHCFIAPQER